MHKQLHSLWTVVILLLLAPQTSFAYTDAEIDAMIKALREENQALKEEVRTLRQQTQSSPQLQEHIVQSSPQATDKQAIKSVKHDFKEQPEAFQVNGFLTAGAARADPAVSDQNRSFGDDINFDVDSIVGVQTTYTVSDSTDVTLQVVARGADNWNLEAEWAFFSYRPTDTLTLRAGHMRLPLYLFSESLEVGFSYPWVRPPVEIYVVPLNSYDGADVNYNFTTGDWVHTLQAFVGNDQDDTFKSDIFFGINNTSHYDAWTLRLGSFFYEVEILESERIPGTPIENGGDYYNMAAVYDDGDWMLITEVSSFNASEEDFFRDTDAGYITLGKYFGRFLPHFTYAKTYTTNEPVLDLPPFFELDPTQHTGTSYTLGTRYELNASTSIKLEWSRYTDLDDTAGIWSGLRLRIPNEAIGVDDIDIYTLVIDTVF